MNFQLAETKTPLQLFPVMKHEPGGDLLRPNLILIAIAIFAPAIVAVLLKWLS